MDDRIEIIAENPVTIEFLDVDGDVVEVLSTAESIIEVLVEGPPGPPGNAGSFHEVEFTAITDGSQSIEITYPPTAFQFLTINGLQQASGDFTVSGTTLNIPLGLSVLAGDKIHFTFSRS